jgi:hypothetical protein
MLIKVLKKATPKDVHDYDILAKRKEELRISLVHSLKYCGQEHFVNALGSLILPSYHTG